MTPLNIHEAQSPALVESFRRHQETRHEQRHAIFGLMLRMPLASNRERSGLLVDYWRCYSSADQLRMVAEFQNDYAARLADPDLMNFYTGKRCRKTKYPAWLRYFYCQNIFEDWLVRNIQKAFRTGNDEGNLFFRWLFETGLSGGESPQTRQTKKQPGATA